MILTESKRTALIQKAKKGDFYAPDNQMFGKNRYHRRKHSRFSPSVKEYNQMNMNKLFKQDIVDLNIRIKGETANYLVRMSFTGFLDELHNFMKTQKEPKLTLRDVSRALSRAFNHSDVCFRCSCPDWKYRMGYWASQNGYIAGPKETIPSNITNPNDTKGSGCKHVVLVLNDASWLVKVASVIYNYTNYMKDNEERLYIDFIYPAIYQKPYEEDEQGTQLGMFDTNDDLGGSDTDEEENNYFGSDQDRIDKANQTARERGRWEKGNKYRFKKAPKEPIDDGEQIEMGDEEV